MHRSHGFSRTELIVAVVVGLALFTIVFMGLPLLMHDGGIRAQMSLTLSNMKQLHLATQQMALDGEFTKNPALGWPGDTGGSFTNWMRHLVPEYLSTNDVAHILSGPGKVLPKDRIPSANEGALLVYAVNTNSPGNTVFLSTANFTNSPTGGTLDPTAKPYGNKGFIIFHKAGDGAILQPRDAGNTNLIGSYAPLCH